MRRNLDNIEIVEPPIEELTKKRSWKGTCFTSCIFLVLLAVVAVVGIRFYVGSGPRISKGIPSDFPADIPIYDKDNIDNITFIPAQYKERGLTVAIILPKIILSPTFYNSKNTDNTGALKNILNTITAPEEDYRDSFQIEWHNVNADPSFVVSYYKKELKKKNFIIDIESEGKTVRQFSFSRADGISGSIYAQGDEAKKSGTDYMLLTVNLPKK